MDFNFIIQRVIGILTKPNQEWEKIKGEQTGSLKDLYLKFGLFVSLVPAIIIALMSFLISSYYMIKYHFSIGGLFKSFFLSFGYGVILFLLLSGSIYLIGLMLDKLSVSFKGNDNGIDSHKLSIYSLTPIMLSSVFFVLAFIFKSFTEHLVLIISLYSTYIFYLGAIKIKNISKDMLIPYTIIFGFAWIVLFELSFFISKQIII